MNNQLFLEDHKGQTEAEIKVLLEQFDDEWFEGCGEKKPIKVRDQLKNLTILIGYQSVGSYGCDSSAYYLFKDNSGNYFELHGSHCSCMGFESQWNLEETPIEYLHSDRFFFGTGGYDENAKNNEKIVREFVMNLI